MRLDYTLVSKSLACRVTAATILGVATAEQKNGGWRTKKFYGSGASFGSDHCPILLSLSEAEGAAAMVCTPAEEDGAAAAAEAEWSEDERYDTP